jgi:hypothetical protein
MSMLWSLALLGMLIQAWSVSAPLNTILDSKEKLKLEKETNPNSRIKIYKQASERIQNRLEQEIIKKNYSSAPEDLKQWTILLSESLKDIETNLRSKKRSKNLIDYEIHLRKSISRTRDYKFDAPSDQHDIFKSCLDEAEKIRSRFVEILFPNK